MSCIVLLLLFVFSVYSCFLKNFVVVPTRLPLNRIILVKPSDPNQFCHIKLTVSTNFLSVLRHGWMTRFKWGKKGKT